MAAPARELGHLSHAEVTSGAWLDIAKRRKRIRVHLACTKNGLCDPSIQ